MGRKIVITAALSGAATMKEANPNVPYTPEEFVQEAKRVEEARPEALGHIERRGYPIGSDWVGWRPDPAWDLPKLPANWAVY